jgi:hypothetical protein
MWSTAFVRLPWRPALFAGALVALCPSTYADTIVSITDSHVPVNRGRLFLGGQNTNVVAVSWSQTAAFSNVIIDASLVSSDSGFRGGMAYLMNAIGPGTTPASEVVAPASFTAPVSTDTSVDVPLTVLFTGLNLGPGTYYLVLAAPHADVFPSPLGWQDANTPVVTSAAAASIGFSFIALGPSVAPFAPASQFNISTSATMFDVSGVLVPEPSSLTLFGIGTLAAAAVLVRRRTKAHG